MLTMMKTATTIVQDSDLAINKKEGNNNGKREDQKAKNKKNEHSC